MITEFIGNLACPLDFGQAIAVVGKTIDSATRLTLNLRTGKDKTSDIGFSFSVRFRQNYIIRSAFVNGEWDTEERQENLGENVTLNPIAQGDFFMICIFAGETKFHIAINNKPFCTYEYRIPVKDIRTIEIKGHVQVIKHVDHRAIYPYSWPPIQCTESKMAFSNDIPVLYMPGHVIVITARVYGNNRGQFIIKFSEGDTRRQHLHFNPRFEPYNVCVRNAMRMNYEWGQEERDGGFPFVFDQQFTLAIAFTEKEFLFAVDGNFFTTFAHRSPDILEDLTGFKIELVNGMKIDVTRVDHFQLPDFECRGFEEYSRNDVDII